MNYPGKQALALGCLLAGLVSIAFAEENQAVDLSPVEWALETSDDQVAQAQSLANPSPPASPDAPVILTTRPSFTDAWLTVPQGGFQAESGATYADNGDRTRAWVLPESLLKLGLTDHTELRFSAPNYIDLRDDDAGRLASNFGDITLGFSHHRRLPGKIDLAVIPLLNIPTGANGVSANALEPQGRVVLARSLTPKLVVASQLDARWRTGRNAAAKVVMNPTLIGYYNFTEKLAVFLEYGGFVPTEGRSAHFAQGGLLYLPTRRQQWDVRVATGLNKNAPDLLVGVGYSFRIDGLFGNSKHFGTFRRSKHGTP